MNSPHLVVVNLILVGVMLVFFAVMDRYAKRHPYGTGHFGKLERRRREHEARREHRRKAPDPGARAQNEAVMAALLATLQSPDSPTTAAGYEPDPAAEDRS